ncbi:protein kinase [Achlya hypogyna]|uniref:Protein kinase n=1 Tax=Achlya hypogyna TaxID=1202772 RepID=A0A1V9Z1E7_ACHHY|nr:protein kinase [Achlya hypogyna]
MLRQLLVLVGGVAASTDLGLFWGNVSGAVATVVESTYTTACADTIFRQRENETSPSCIRFPNNTVGLGSFPSVIECGIDGRTTGIQVTYLQFLPRAAASVTLDAVGLTRLNARLDVDDTGAPVALSSFRLFDAHTARSNLSGNAIDSLANVQLPPQLETLCVPEVVWASDSTTDISHNSLTELIAAFPSSLQTLCLGPNAITAFYANASQVALLQALSPPSTACALASPATNTTCRNHVGMVLLWGTYPVCVIADCVATPFPLAPVLGGVCAFIMVAAIGAFCYCRRRKRVFQSTLIEMEVRSWYSSAATPQPGTPLSGLDRASVHLNAEFRELYIPPAAFTRGHVLARTDVAVFHRALLQRPGEPEAEMVTMKHILSDTTSDPEALASFLDEIRLIAPLHHPKIVRFIGLTWRSMRQLAIVTEYMEQGDLWCVLQRSPVSWLEDVSGFAGACVTKLALLQDVADGLRYLHSCDPVVYHRSVKAKNVAINGAWEAKLTEFGSVRQRPRDGDVATAAWSAPEVLAGERFTDKADVYALGVLISEMDTCAAPFACDDAVARASETHVAVMVVSGATPTFREDCPPAVRSMAERCLAYHRDERPSAKEVFNSIWGAITNRSPRDVSLRTFTTDCGGVNFTYPSTWSPLISPTCIWWPLGRVSRAALEKKRNGMNSTVAGLMAIMNGLDVNFSDNNQVDHIESLPATVATIVLDNLGIQSLNANLAVDFHGDTISATTLQMGNNSITTIDNVDFPGSLRTLSLQNNSITKVGKINAKGLTAIVLDRNKVTNLDSTDLFPANIEGIFMGWNNLQSLRDAVFPRLVTTIDVGSNNITDLHGVAWPPLLLHLNISSNGLTSIDNITFPESLGYLEMVDNAITELHANFPPQLQTLCLAKNNITALYANESQFQLLSNLSNNSTQLTYINHVDGAGRSTGTGPCDIFLSTTTTNSTCHGHVRTELLWDTFPVCIVADTAAPLPPPPAESAATAAIPITFAVLVSVLVVVALAVCYRRRRTRTDKWLFSTTDRTSDLEVAILDRAAAVANDVRFDARFHGAIVPAQAVTHKEMVAKGGYGAVFVATVELRGTATRVAMKRLLAERADDTCTVEAFMDEIRLMSQLEHPNVVAFLGITWTNLHNIALLTEYMERGDLWQLLSTDHRLAWHVAPYLPVDAAMTKLPETTKKTDGGRVTKDALLLDVVKGLRYLHGCEPTVVHRDLKAKNVLVSANYTAKLADFGSSRLYEEEDNTMTSEIGTIPWIAPEVLKGVRYSEKADVYSLGVLMAEMDTHRVPYADFTLQVPDAGVNVQMTKARIAMLVVAGDLRPSFTTTCPPSILSIATRCLAYDPAARPTAAQVHAWLQYLRAAAA